MKIDRPYLPMIYRDSSIGWMTGVCAGMSEITGVHPVLLRASALIATYMFPLMVVPAYAIAVLLLRDRGRPSGSMLDAAAPTDLEASRGYQNDDGVLQQRLVQLEEEVSSGDAELRRRFRDAGLA